MNKDVLQNSKKNSDKNLKRSSLAPQCSRKHYSREHCPLLCRAHLTDRTTNERESAVQVRGEEAGEEETEETTPRSAQLSSLDGLRCDRQPNIAPTYPPTTAHGRTLVVVDKAVRIAWTNRVSAAAADGGGGAGDPWNHPPTDDKTIMG